MKIAVASPKGGAGKTTLTACLSLALVEAKRWVDAWDFDPQAGLSNWLERLSNGENQAGSEVWIQRNDPKTQLAVYGGLSTLSRLGEARGWRLANSSGEGYGQTIAQAKAIVGGAEVLTIAGAIPADIVLGDFPPCDPETLAGMLKGWDRVLIPCQPSPVDVQAVMALVAVLKRDSRPLLVWNGLDGSSYSRPETLKTLGAEVGCPIAKATIPRRVGFRNSQLAGYRGLDEASKSAILSLALEVMN